MSKKKSRYKVKSTDTVTEIKWDDLVPLYTATSESLQVGINGLKETGIAFNDAINNNPEIGKMYLGISKSYADLTEELTGIIELHSKKVKNDDTKLMEYRPFVGKVSTDEKHQEVYLYSVMAYGGLNDKIIQVIDNVLITLMGAIKEEATKLEALVDNKLKEEGTGNE